MADADNDPKSVDVDESFANQRWDKDIYALAHKILARFPNIRYEDREDIIHEFAIKHPNMEGYGGRSKLSTWLHRCLSNMALDFLKKVNQTRTKEENRIVVESITGDEDHPAHQLRQGGSPCPDTMEIAFYVMVKKGRFSKEPVELAAHIVAEVIEITYCSRSRKNSGAAVLQPGEEIPSLPVELIGKHLMECDICTRLASKFEAEFHEHDLKLPYLAMRHYVNSLEEEKKMPDNIRQSSLDDDEREKRRQALIQEVDDQIKGLTKYRDSLVGPSDPVTKNQRVCSNCKKPGHNAKTCKEPKNSEQKDVTKTVV